MPPEMTPKERFLAFLQGQPLDRYLCVPLILNHANRAAGLRVGETLTNGPALGQAHVDCYRKFGQDMVTLFADTSLIAEAMGTKLQYFDDDAPRVDTPVVQTPGDLAKVKRPDPHSDGRLPVFLEAIKTANSVIGDEVFVACCFAMPFTIAAALMGTDIFVKATRKDPTLAHRLLQMATDAAADYTDAVIAAGGVPVPVDPVASCSVIGPKQYAEFARPYTQRILEKIAAAGLPPVLHICGHSHLIWDQMVDGGAAVLSLDKVDLAAASAAVGSRCCLMGNVPPAEMLLYGTPELVAERTLQGIREAGHNPGGYIVASGCEVPLGTPDENIEAMLQTVREYGKPA